MYRRTGNLAWIAAALSLFLVFVLPACWSGALTRAWVELGQGPSSNNTNEEREEREHSEEGDAARLSTRPPAEASAKIAEGPRAAPPRQLPVRLASVAPKLHPSRFSERRLR